jgi:hypothetical protein
MSAESNKFAKIFNNLSKVSPTPEAGPTEAKHAEKKNPRTGRPPGKKSDPAFSQVTVYLRKVNHQEARRRLFSESREFSELIDELLANWLETSGSPKVQQSKK